MTSTPHPKPIAHWTHTLALFAMLLITSLLGRYRSMLPADGTSHLVRYVSSIAWEWLMLGAVVSGVYDRRTFLARAVLQRVSSLLTVFAWAFVVYCAGFLAIAATGSLLYFTPLFHKRNEAVILAMVPRTAPEFLVWFAVSLTAGICEELVFRAYLLQQLSAWFNNSIAAILAVGAVFGCIHLYEGIAAMIPLAALGMVYGFVVHRLKGDLRAVIVAHALQDFMIAFLVLARPLAERHQSHAS